MNGVRMVSNGVETILFCVFMIGFSIMTMTLAVTARDKSKSLEVLRTSGYIPAVIYGPAQEPTEIAIEEKIFDKVRRLAGESTVLELTGLSKAMEVLIKEVDFNPVKQQIMHVDFLALEKGKEITTHVPLHFVGIAPVEDLRLGTVNKVLHEVEVVCTPANLPSFLNVDLSGLKTLEDKIRISDIALPAGVQITLEAEETVAVVAQEKSDESTEDEAAAIDMSAIEVEKKGKTEVEEA